ncbi:very-long-chain (3R)-3-hydroxyacyl-CoA dehydratase [Chelonus insularis]|uniref:very-long-chain (3R)-3-hydroxyacyl-CoA dehydratase n=1 Tax=Chelonus insularis TaxID=460826 RepID=UPI00158EAA07|nr:very-long-chain (3R)-3-hydroxyacyl-CoA dehydratase [Chelonus insularis]
MATSRFPTVYWNQTDKDISLRIDINNPQGSEISFEESSMRFSAFRQGDAGPVEYNFTLNFYDSIEREENVYELIDKQLQFLLKKKSDGEWPQLTSLESDPSWTTLEPEKPEKNIRNKENKKSTYQPRFKKLSEEYAQLNEQIHREELDKRDVHEDYPKMYDELHKEEMGYRKEDLRVVYLVLYNLCQFVGFIYVITIMTIRYSREGPDSMEKTYESVGNIMKFIHLLQFLEVMHPMFGYTKGSTFVAFLQVGGRAFVLFCMIECEPRMQTKPVVFYLFFIWSLVEVFRYPYYITQVLNVNIPLLTWFRYTIWIPLYPLGFLCEGIIILRNIPYFEETNKFTISLPNSWNFAFHFPTVLRMYLLLLALPGMYTMMSHMNEARKKKLAIKKSQKKSDKKS